MHLHYVHFYSLLFFVFYVSALAQESDDHPRISFISKAQIKNAGGNAYFSCHVVNPGDNTVTWLKVKSSPSEDLGDQEVIVIAREDTVLVETEEETRINVRNVGTYYTLQIRNLRPDDAGSYHCQLTHNVGATTELFVRSPPVFSTRNNDENGLVIIDQGNAGELTCFADGYPTPDIFWTRGENFTESTLEQTGNIFRIPYADRKTTRGRYYCLARNSLGEVGKSIDVEVTFVPRIGILRPIFGATLGRDTELECFANGFPAPVITWIKGSTIIENDDHYGISQVRSGVDNLTNATLSISSIQVNHFGVYTCRAENGLGFAEEKITVLQNVFQDYSGSIESDGKSKTFPASDVPKSPTPTEMDILVSIDTPAAPYNANVVESNGAEISDAEVESTTEDLYNL